MLAAALVLALLPAGTAPAAKKTRPILMVANNWAGTADVVDPRRFSVLKRINIIPDIEQRMSEIQADPVAYAYFLGIRQLVGEGHDQWVDDAFTSRNGRLVFVSRPKVHVIDTRAGRIVGEFESGDQPHENNYSRDGKLIYHASIGSVFTPLDDPLLDDTKGDRWFQIVDARTLQVLRRIDMGDKLAEHGFPDMSAAVRPMPLSPDERYCFVSVSGDDRVSVISYRTGREVARIAVGDHPQRMRMGRIRRQFVR